MLQGEVSFVSLSGVECPNIQPFSNFQIFKSSLAQALAAFTALFHP
jgi:hypothetical protein